MSRRPSLRDMLPSSPGRRRVRRSAVRAAEQPHRIRGMSVCAGEALDVVELEEAGFCTPAAAFVDERAPAAVTFVHLTADCGGDVASFDRFGRSRSARLAARCDRCQITIWDAIAQKVLHDTQLVPEQVARGELDLPGVLRERTHERPRRRGRDRRRQGCRGRRRDRRRRHLANDGRDGRLWREAHDQLLDLAFRLPSRAREHLLIILGGQVRHQQPQTGEMHATRSQRVDHRRQPARGARDEDSAICGIFGKPSSPTQNANSDGNADSR